MKKTLCLTFELLPEAKGSEAWAVLSVAEEKLQRRTLNPMRERNTLLALYTHNGWERSPEDVGSREYPENSFWDIPLAGMIFTGIRATYDNALMPSEHRDVIHDLVWRNGEERCWGPRERPAVITCLPSRKTVSIFMDVPIDEETDSYRRDFLHIQKIIENRIILTRDASRLIKAFKSVPQNSGRVRRFEKELFLNIGRL